MPVGTEKFRIRANEVDFNHLLTVPALVNFLQETAMHNIGDIGLPMQVLYEKNLGWVLSRMYLKISTYPKETETVSVETCPLHFDKYYAYRDFRVYDAQNQLLATASTSWLMFDLAKRQLIAIPDFARESVAFCTDKVPLFLPKNKIAPLKNIDFQSHLQVKWHDLDANRHVNNVLYFQWALDTLPELVLSEFQLTEFDIIFRNECRLGEKITSQISEIIGNEDIKLPENKTFIHRIVKEADQKEVIQAQTQWRKKS
jgi:medium-chain acyl-[acyl-carrier-protein] hydrolase